MPRKTFVQSIYYFDVVAAAIGFAVVAGILFISIGEHSPWSRVELLALGILFLGLVTLGLCRPRSYQQPMPWLIMSFGASAVVAIVVVFRHWGLLWLIVAMGLASVMLVVGLVMRRKLISETVSRTDIFKLLTIAVSLVVGIMAIEVVLRLVPGLLNEEMQQLLRADPRNYGVAHPYIGHLHKPNSTIVISGRDFKAFHHTDGQGFRNRWPWPDAAEIVIVGDSVGFGYGAADDEAWPAVLSRSLSRSRVINLSLIGAGAQQYLRVYETFGTKLRPKLLLVAFLASNDFWDAGVFDDWLRSGVGGNYMVWRDFGRPQRVSLNLRDPVASLEAYSRSTLYPLVRRSHLYNLVSAAWRGAAERRLAPPKVVEFGDGRRLQLLPSAFLRNAALGRSEQREFHLVREALQRIHSIARQNAAHTLVVLQPGKEDVYLPLLGESVPDPSSSLRDALEALGIDYVDLGPAFRQRAAAGEQLFFEVDGHPNPAGYALIAQLVLSHLQENPDRYGLERDFAMRSPDTSVHGMSRGRDSVRARSSTR